MEKSYTLPEISEMLASFTASINESLSVFQKSYTKQLLGNIEQFKFISPSTEIIKSLNISNTFSKQIQDIIINSGLPKMAETYRQAAIQASSLLSAELSHLKEDIKEFEHADYLDDSIEVNNNEQVHIHVHYHVNEAVNKFTWRDILLIISTLVAILQLIPLFTSDKVDEQRISSTIVDQLETLVNFVQTCNPNSNADTQE